MADVFNIILCTYCAEKINSLSKKCKHCGEILDPHLRDIEFLKSQRASPQVFMNAGGGGGGASSSSSSAAAVAAMPAQNSLQLRGFRHWLHVLLSILSGGLWVPIYFLLFIFRNKNVYY